MPRLATRDDVQRLMVEGANIVEVLPYESYEQLHIAGALSIPLKALDERAPHELDRSTPVVVYCTDFL